MLPTRRQFLLRVATVAAIPVASASRADNRARFAPFDKLGLANVDKNVPVEADSPFRIASISKPITAVAVLQLVDANKTS